MPSVPVSWQHYRMLPLETASTDRHGVQVVLIAKRTKLCLTLSLAGCIASLM
jgi:hypothetical protein